MKNAKTTKPATKYPKLLLTNEAKHEKVTGNYTTKAPIHINHLPPQPSKNPVEETFDSSTP